MTVHQAKGLEFPVVWIYGLNEGVLPSHRTIRERGETGLEEERRLMYIACTRAMEGSFRTQNEHYSLRRVKARKKETETLYIIFGIHTANVVQLAARLMEQQLAEAA